MPPPRRAAPSLTSIDQRLRDCSMRQFEPERFTASRLHSIHQVEAREWDQCDPSAGLYASWAWLSSEERDPLSNCFYLVVRDKSGNLVGAVACYAPRVDFSPRYDLRSIFNEPSLPRSKETLLVGSKDAYHSALRISAELSGAARAEVRQLLIEQVKKSALELGRHAVMLYASEPVPEADSSAVIEGDAAIELPGVTWSDWMATLKSKRRAQIRHEVKSFEESGWSITEANLPDVVDDCVPLLGALRERYGSSASPRTIRSQLLRRHEATADIELVLVAKQRDVIGGFAMGYRYHNTLWMRATGFDYERSGSNFAYFNLVYYSAIAVAYRSGLSKLHLGINSLRAKTLRGASIAPLYCHTFGWEITRDRLRDKHRQIIQGVRQELGSEAAGSLLSSELASVS